MRHPSRDAVGRACRRDPENRTLDRSKSLWRPANGDLTIDSQPFTTSAGPAELRAAAEAMSPLRVTRHCEERSDEQSSSLWRNWIASLEPVIGRAFARPVWRRPVGSQ